jgi:hypothetical protein
MIRGAAGAHGIFLERPQRWRRLARVEDGDAPAARLDEPARTRRDAGKALQKVERGALADQQRASGARDLGNDFTGTAELAVVFCRRERGGRPFFRFCDLPERFERDVESRQHAVLLHQKHAACLRRRLNRRLGGHIAAADVLFERATHEVAIEIGV